MNDYSYSRNGKGEAIKSPDHFLRTLAGRISKNTVITFIAALIFAFVVHGFMFANKLPNHDDISHLFGSEYGVASGRWLLPFLLGLDGSISAPWVIGAISSVFLAFAVCLTASVLRLRGIVTRVLLGLVMVSFPAVGSIFTYMFSADAYFFSLMLACLAAWLTVRYRFGFIGGAVAVALSLGVYQSYLGVTAALLASALILEAIDGEDFRKIALRALKFLAALAVGLAAYFLIVKLTTRNEPLVDYMGIADMGKISLRELPRLIANAYESYFHFYISDVRGVHFGYMPYVFAFFLIAAAVLFFSVISAKKLKLPRALLTVFLLALLPLAGGLIYVMVPREDVHELMIYGLSIFLIFPLALYELRTECSPQSGMDCICNAACWFVAISLALVSYNYGIYTNNAYMKMSLSYEQAASYSTRLLSAVEGFEEYDVNTPIVLVGKAFTQVEFTPTPELEEVNMTGAINAESFVNSYSYGYFLRYYMGASNIIYATESPQAKTMSQSPTVEEMPIYPADGSIALVDEYIVVRLS